MSSPFEIFRRHQIMTVVLIGLAMLAFVIFGAVQDPGSIPPGLWMLAFGAIIGGVAWVVGLKSRKQNEYGVIGFIAGLVAAAGFSLANKPSADIEIAGGGLTEMELQNLRSERTAANTFMQAVHYEAVGDQGRPLTQGLFQLYQPQDPEGERHEAVDWELLRREADRLGIEVSNDAVNDYLTTLTGGRLRKEHIDKARKRVGISEPDLYRVMRKNLAAMTALTILFSNQEFPPQKYHDFYQRLNDLRDFDLVGVPVEAFLDQVGEPSDSDLQTLFNEYRESVPNLTSDNRIAPGRPGFFQAQKMQLAYVEFTDEAVRELVDQPTDEEIQALYDEKYGKTLDDPFIDAPKLPSPEMDASEPATKSTPEDSAATTETTPAEPAEPDASANKPADKEPASESVPAEEPAGEDSPSEDAAPEGESTGAVIPFSGTYPVVFFQEEEAAEPTVDESAEEAAPSLPAPAAEPKETETAAPTAEEPEAKESPSSDSEAASSEDAESTDKPAMELKTDGEPEKKSAPPAPSEEPLLDDEPADVEPPTLDEVREELINQIVDRRVLDKQTELMNQAQTKLISLVNDLALSEDDEEGLQPEEVTERMEQWAAENGGSFGKTGLQTRQQLYDSEDYPVGRAAHFASGRPTGVFVSDVASSMTLGKFFNGQTARDLDTESAFVWWKVADKKAGAADSLDDPGVRELVVEAWKQQQAFPKAQARAEELSKLMAEVPVDQPVQDKLGDTTITGQAGGDYVEPKVTGPITWMETPRVPGRNPFAPVIAETKDLTRLLSLDAPLGDEFMKTVFRKISPGETGIAANENHSVVYAVRVKPVGQPTDTPNESFLKEPFFQMFSSPYTNMSFLERRQVMPNALKELEEKYGVDLEG